MPTERCSRYPPCQLLSKDWTKLSPPEVAFYLIHYWIHFDGHQTLSPGAVLPWLGGFYMEACLKLYKRTRFSFLERQMVGYEDEMTSHCLGTISELYDGNPPFTGRGAISFAMNVGEILRTLELMEKYQY